MVLHSTHLAFVFFEGLRKRLIDLHFVSFNPVVAILSRLHPWNNELKSCKTKLNFNILKVDSANQFTGVYMMGTVVFYK